MEIKVLHHQGTTIEQPAGRRQSGFDIFCRVIDNFGDIGVCWRLAKQLSAAPYWHSVRLWIDNLYNFAKIESGVDPSAPMQTVRGVRIVHWTDRMPALQPRQVVIEAFACDPPEEFIRRMIRQQSLWINLEYLSAESWVESCHALPSPQANGLNKVFFFPGFTCATAGLQREPGLIETRDLWQSQPALRWKFLHELGMPNTQIEGLQQGARQVFLFCYPQAPIRELLASLASQDTPSTIIIAQGVHASIKDQLRREAQVFEAPFVDQAGFDRLLWSSDLNFVRGEDSLTRALWAGRPFVWHIYQQEQQAQLPKLHAWLARAPFDNTVQQLILLWNTSQALEFTAQMNQALSKAGWHSWRRAAAGWCENLVQQPDLVQSIHAFCTKHARKG